MGQKDITEKKLEAYNDVFSDIVNNLLFGGRNLVGEDELAEGRERSFYEAKDKTVREQERDVCKLWKQGNASLRIAYFGLENETEPEDDMPFRVIGYDGAAYRDEIRYVVDEKGKRQKIIERYPVVTLVLYLGYRKRWDRAKSIYEALGDRLDEELKPYVQDYRINLFEIAWLTNEQVGRFKSDFRILADYLVQMRKNGDYIPSDFAIVHIREVLRMMTAVTGDDRFSKEADTISVDREEKNMSEGTTMKSFFSRALDEREAQGEARGEARGEVRGAQNAARLFNFLWHNGRGADAERAEADPAYLKQLINEFNAKE